MLFDLISDAKVHIILITPNKNLLLFEKFICFVAFFCKKFALTIWKFRQGKEIKITDAPYFVKIPVQLKISVSLKISVRSENPYLKISGGGQIVRSGASVPESCKGLQAAPEKAGEQESHKGRAGRKAKNKTKFAIYIGIIAPNEKYLQKS